MRRAVRAGIAVGAVTGAIAVMVGYGLPGEPVTAQTPAGRSFDAQEYTVRLVDMQGGVPRYEVVDQNNDPWDGVLVVGPNENLQVTFTIDKLMSIPGFEWADNVGNPRDWVRFCNPDPGKWDSGEHGDGCSLWAGSILVDLGNTNNSNGRGGAVGGGVRTDRPSRTFFYAGRARGTGPPVKRHHYFALHFNLNGSPIAPYDPEVEEDGYGGNTIG